MFEKINNKAKKNAFLSHKIIIIAKKFKYKCINYLKYLFEK
jgi:hypothetical protein